MAGNKLFANQWFGCFMKDNNYVVSIEFSPLSTVELTTNWYHLHNGDYQLYDCMLGAINCVYSMLI